MNAALANVVYNKTGIDNAVNHSMNGGDNVTLQKSAEYGTLIEAIQTLDTHLNKVRERDQVKEQLLSAERAITLLADFKRQMADIYRDPERAYELFAATCVTAGVEEAIAKITNDPDAAGELKGWAIGPLNNSARTAILKLSLPMALKTGGAGLTNHLIAGGGAYGQADLNARVEKLKSRLEHLNDVAGVSGDRISLELKVAEAARKVPEQDLGQLSGLHLKMVEDLVHKCKPLLIDTRSPDEVRREELRKAAEKKSAEEATATNSSPEAVS